MIGVPSCVRGGGRGPAALLLALAVLAAAMTAARGGSLATDKAALLRFMRGLDDPGQLTDGVASFKLTMPPLSPWLENTQPCGRNEFYAWGNWTSVSCFLDRATDTVRVDQIIFGYAPGGAKLSGTLPNAGWHTQLDFLQTLDIKGHNMHGTLPDWQGWDSLTSINLSGNKLSGSLPSWRGWTKLAGLNLAGNKLRGELPPQWSQMKSLRILSLEGNYPGFLGPLPAAWGGGAWPSLIELDLGGSNLAGANQLTGPIPCSWASATAIPKLEKLVVPYHKLSGNLPTAWPHPVPDAPQPIQQCLLWAPP